MKINVLAENLKKGVSICMRGVSARAQLPILSTILLKASKEGVVCRRLIWNCLFE